MFIFILYVISICFEEKFDIKNDYKYLSVYIFAFVVLGISTGLLKLEYDLYFYGSLVNFIYVICLAILFISFIFTIVFVIKRKNRKVVPLLVFIFSGAISIYIQYKCPELILLPSIQFLSVMLMYFTIDNPPADLIEKLDNYKNKLTDDEIAINQLIDQMRLDLQPIIGYKELIDNKVITSKEDKKEYAMFLDKYLDNLKILLNNIICGLNHCSESNDKVNILKIVDKLKMPLKKMAKEYGNTTISFKISKNLNKDIISNEDYLELLLFNIIINSIENTTDGFIAVEISLDEVIIDKELKIEVFDDGKSENYENFAEKDDNLTIEKIKSISKTDFNFLVAKQIIKIMSGKLEVESKGKYNHFTIIIPCRH